MRRRPDPTRDTVHSSPPPSQEVVPHARHRMPRSRPPRPPNPLFSAARSTRRPAPGSTMPWPRSPPGRPRSGSCSPPSEDAADVPDWTRTGPSTRRPAPSCSPRCRSRGQALADELTRPPPARRPGRAAGRPAHAAPARSRSARGRGRPRRLALPLLRETLRGNDSTLIEAALGPYAAAHLPDTEFGQAALKCLHPAPGLAHAMAHGTRRHRPPRPGPTLRRTRRDRVGHRPTGPGRLRTGARLG